VALTLAIEDISLAGARRGDPVAWADLYSRFHPVLARYLEIVAPDGVAGVDDVWERAGRNLAGQPEGIDPLVWLLRTARDGMALAPSPDDTDDPTIAAIRRLSPVQMDVAALRVVARLSEGDVAAIIGRPESLVRAITQQALAELLRFEDR
jgi:DNA-directed RNA polymerase specialized sigma24 family protein